MEVNMRGLDIPHVQMGAVSSADLFEDREQELFDLYERHKDQYKVVLDVGANIGVHTIIMAKLGWNVLAFEPDPEHMKHLRENVARNGVRATLYSCALATKSGEMDFIRVLGNTTANHLEGARTYYGPGERIKVNAVPARSYITIADFAKIDAEGSEADILCSVPPELKCEYLVEISSEENARRIWEHFFAYKKLWVQRGGRWIHTYFLADMPTHYKHGSLFIGEQP